MGRKTVRTAIQTYLQTAATAKTLLNVSKIYAHPPKLTPSGTFYAGQDPGHGTGCVIYLHLKRQNESRIAIGGPTNGMKARPYVLTMLCFLRSKKIDTQDVGDDNDEFLDSLTALIEADRSAGAPATIFQWGEGHNLFGVDIDVKAGMPRPLRSGNSQVFSTVDVVVYEILNT
ncbi:MAG: hypothetical protein KGL39_54945 [Patescibacteria group bacterium]|nr:hypothetical protein [Patescibacteria group bacterium]